LKGVPGAPVPGGIARYRNAARDWPRSGRGRRLVVRRHHALAALPRAYANRVRDRDDEDLAVPDLAAAGVGEDYLDRLLDVLVGADDVEPELRPEVQPLRRPAVVLHDAGLTAGAEDVRDRHARQADRVQLG